MRAYFKVVIFIAVLAFTSSSSAQVSASSGAINLATFNVGWWVDQEEFSEMLKECSAKQPPWCDPRDKQTGCSALPARLPVCNAYAKYHRIGNTKRLVYAPTPDTWEAKRGALERTLRRVDPDVIAFQEISGEQAARDILRFAQADFHYCVSKDLPKAGPHAQRLVIAARKSLFALAACETDGSVAVEDAAQQGKFTRPALIARLMRSDNKGPLTVAAVHLKSACSSPAGDEQYGFRGSYLNDEPPDGADSTAPEWNCRTLRKQVVPLEQLIERETAGGIPFVLLGDFNRKLHLETDPRPHKAGPVRTGSSKVRVGIPADTEPVRLLWPEINDGDPPTSVLHLVPAEPHAATCARNEGLDHIALSSPLTLDNRFAWAREVVLENFAFEFPASDHCPLAMRLRLP